MQEGARGRVLKQEDARERIRNEIVILRLAEERKVVYVISNRFGTSILNSSFIVKHIEKKKEKDTPVIVSITCLRTN